MKRKFSVWWFIDQFNPILFVSQIDIASQNYVNEFYNVIPKAWSTSVTAVESDFTNLLVRIA